MLSVKVEKLPTRHKIKGALFSGQYRETVSLKTLYVRNILLQKAISCRVIKTDGMNVSR